MTDVTPRHGSPAVEPHPLPPCPADAQFWLMKIEPDECSIEALAARPGGIVAWTGVRNYQARNFMRDAMRVGDGVLYYHSSCPQPGIAGLAEVASAPYADPTQFDPASPWHDPKASTQAPRWWLVDVRHRRSTRLLGLPEMRATPALAGMEVLRPGSRLSITPVTPTQWHAVLALLDPA